MLTAPPTDEPAGDVLLRDQFGLHRMEWPDDLGINFVVGHGEMLALLRATGFEVETLHEVRAPEGDPAEVRYFVRRGWARSWPCEDIWVARRTDEAGAVSRRDLAHVLTALAELSGERAGAGVAVADVDAAVGRTRGDMRTPLNLGALAVDGLAEQLGDGRWALTAAGLDRHRQDEAYESR